MYLLGITAYHAEASAVLLRDGALVAAVEEERLRRVKHWAGFPDGAIRACLEVAGIAGADVDAVAVGRDPRAHLGRKVAFALRRRARPSWVRDRLRNARRVRDVRGPLRSALGLEAGEPGPTLHFVEHHDAHLASTFFASPFDDAAVCALDGFGDFVSTSLAAGEGTRLRRLDSVFFPHSLGILYTAVTQYLGFRRYGDEYKVMGLAPYGQPRFVPELRRLVRLEPRGRFRLALPFFSHWSDGVVMEWDDGPPSVGPLYSRRLEALLGPARGPDQPLDDRHEDIAHSLQAVFEEALFHVLEGLWDRTRNPRLCLAGGCAMNSVANGKVRDRTPFTDVYIQPAAADNGTALGAALQLWHHVSGHPRGEPMDHAYWGPAFPDDDAARALAALDAAGDDFVSATMATDAETCRATARLLADGAVVGWFQGRMEWGARALGNRSILADPRRTDARDRINARIKFREKFRPFAPSVLESAVDEYFVGAVADPFMMQVYPVRPEKRDAIPAVVHVDGTGRIHTVGESANPMYHRLIREFEAITGVPVLLNTSFNENEPIVHTPAQAVDCFRRTRMDALVMGNTIVQRVAAPALNAVSA